jgi:hypothetical protein
MTRRLPSIALALCALGVAGQAHAQQYAPPPPGPAVATNGVDRPGGIVGVILGVGAKTGYGFGLGAEGGYSFPFHLYVGGNFTYFTGSSGVSAYLFEPQVGYDLAVIPNVPVLIRPYVGIGYEGISVSNCPFGACGGGSGIITPGVLGAYFFTPNFYAGLDLRFDIATASYGSAVFDIFATGGYKF